MLLSACTVVGPTAIHSGRLAYNKAIIETDNQQMLLVIVRNRYGERSNLLAVSSVTANISITANAGVEVGVGDNDNYAGNIVPFRAGVIYEENPTISYTPVGGEQYARRLMSPISIAPLAQLADNLVDTALVYYALVSSVNGILNPDFLSGESAPDVRFPRLVTILTELTRAHRLHWIQDPQQMGSFSIAIDHYAPDYVSKVHELLALLGLSTPKDRSTPIVLPVYLALDGHDRGGISITTRSVFNLLEILSGAVAVPDQDLAYGVATSYPPLGLLGRKFKVHYAEGKPAHACLAVSYRHGWYYIDDTDQPTKQFFRLLTSLMSINIAESAGRKSAAPVLTVPVSR